MSVGGPPTIISDRHKAVAIMRAAGMRNKDIAAELGFSPNRISIILSHPGIQALIDQYRERMVDETLSGVQERLAREAMPSLRKLTELRDHSEDEGVQERVATKLLFQGYLDRVAPVRRDAPNEESNKVALPKDVFMEMVGELKESGKLPANMRVIDVTPGEVEEPKMTKVRKATKVRSTVATMEEMLEELGEAAW